MGRSKSDLFKVDGQPLFAPDEDVSLSFEDLDASDSGRDEAGVMHRIVVRYKVGTWSFEYSHISNSEYQYMEELFSGKADFQFTHPSRVDCETSVTTKAYRSKYGIVWHSARTKDYRNYKFSIIEC